MLAGGGEGFASLLDQGPVVCDAASDLYGRLLVRCKVNNQSINEQLVARPRPTNRRDYLAAEAEAKEKLGVRQGQFVQPSVFRRSSGIFTDRP
jgi:endonuclease YncB( thermonuclease family)